MKVSNDQFKIEVVKKDIKITRRKFSADHRYRESAKQRQYTPSWNHDRMRQSISFDKQKKNSGCLDTIFHKQREVKQFSDKCVNLLSKKKISLSSQNDSKSTNFNTMLQNIKNVIKQNERKERDQRQSSEPLYNNEFQCVRSQIHQVYSNEEKIQIYRMLRNSQSRNGSRKQSKIKVQKQQKIEALQSSNPKPLYNPFFNLNTVVCFTMALNDPNYIKKPPFENPFSRTISSACSKKLIQITKLSQPKSMNFQLSNDTDSQYTKKLKNFFDFLFKVNFSNNIYVCLQLNKTQQTKYRVHIGKGNNSLLIKSLIKRRFWWQIVEALQAKDVMFYWTQNIDDKIEAKQVKSVKKIVSGDKLNRKSRQIDDIYDQNRKILPLQKISKIQKYITRQGYILPFQESFSPDIMTNHIPRNYCIGSKKNLFKSLFHYFTYIKHKDPFDYIPQTYHIKSIDGPEYRNFIKENQGDPKKVWIVKPGENSNRGRGIYLANFTNVNQLIKKTRHENGLPFTYIIQSYINRPFLYNNRKFDIRHFMMITSINGIIKAYWYRDGYLRTSSQIFDLQDLDNQFIHLTNDAIQKHSEDYERYEAANKLSYSEFQRYLDYSHPSKNYNFERDIIPKMKQMAAWIIKANYQIIDHKRHKNNFQIYGLDFMIDRDFKPWLIELNYNPCLEINCPVLERVIPALIENSFRLSIDPLFPPPCHFPVSKRFYLSDNYIKNLKYELIFDEESLKTSIVNNYDFLDEKQKEDEFHDDGQELNELLV